MTYQKSYFLKIIVRITIFIYWFVHFPYLFIIIYSSFHSLIIYLFICITLLFANDQVLITQEYEDMKFMVRKLLEEYKKWDLKINKKSLEDVNNLSIWE